jgi:predicted ABC-type ATPase
MTVVAGPPGSGKSSRFPLYKFEVDWFNADDRAAELNLGSYHKISAEIRAKVNREFERWILDHIQSRQSFAIETTLRSPITFEQARLASEHGFRTAMEYVIPGAVDECVRRIMERSYRGGHSASEGLIREIYEKSTKNLVKALDFDESAVEVVRIYDNSRLGESVREVLSFRKARPQFIASEIPSWMESLFTGTRFEIAALRQALG